MCSLSSYGDVDGCVDCHMEMWMGVIDCLMEMWMGVLIVIYGDVDGCVDCLIQMIVIVWMGVLMSYGMGVLIVLWRCGWVSPLSSWKMWMGVLIVLWRCGWVS